MKHKSCEHSDISLPRMPPPVPVSASADAVVICKFLKEPPTVAPKCPMKLFATLFQSADLPFSWLIQKFVICAL
ncbi:MAG: hypothetical protein LBP35_03555 [Candidatus Ancillula trichonymphae]|nr:hypothetical protein [Candidatus Ancillula trichonymphae]